MLICKSIINCVHLERKRNLFKNPCIMLKNLTPLMLLLMQLIVAPARAQEPALWLRSPAISPDGQTIVFTYKGDLYAVPSTGGSATPLTTHVAYDHQPVWSPDGQFIAFASDRFGNFDIYTIAAKGGEPKRLTYHSGNESPSSYTADGSHIVFSASIKDKASNMQFPSGALSELYQVPARGGRISQILTTPALHASFNSDGSVLVYHDRKGYENRWRKHHTSSITRDLWKFDKNTGRHTQLTRFKGEDRWPVFNRQENALFYLSEQYHNNFNVCKISLDNPGASLALTNFGDHPVRYLSASDDELLCFSYDGQLYTLREGEEPSKIPVYINSDRKTNPVEYTTHQSGATEMAVSPETNEIALIVRGDIFVTSVDYQTTKRITNTPHQERSISFSPDGRNLLYASEREGSWNIYETRLVREEEERFSQATLIEEQPVVITRYETFQPAYSPDGEEIAFLEDRTTLKVINKKTGHIREILSGRYNYSYSDGDQWYQWSPDGNWFLVQYSPQQLFSNEAGLIKASGDGEIINLTKSGYEDHRPKWMMEGKMMLWFTDRQGLRSHGSWGSQSDVYGLFFEPEAWEVFNLSREDYKIHKKEKNKDNDNDQNQKKEKDKTEQPVEPLTIELKNIEDRMERLTIHSSSLSDAVMTDDGEKLFYLSRFEENYDLWMHDFIEDETKKIAELGTRRGGSLLMDQKKEHLFLLSGGSIKKIGVKDHKVSPVRFEAFTEVKKQEEKQYLFEHIWRQVREKFYVKDLHGVDWEFYKQAYSKFLPHIENNYDFAEMLSEMLGELNASHTGARYSPRHENEDETASLGIFIDWEHAGPGVKITEILDKSPLVQTDSRIKAGHIIEKINGQPLGVEINHFRLLNHQGGKKTLLSLYDPQEDERWEETIEPISRGREYQMLYDRWVENMRRMTDELSGGKLGYVHVRGMNDGSFRKVYSDLLGRNYHKEGVVIDTRFNGGGWLHNDLAVLFNGTKYVDYVPRGQHFGHDPMDQWTKKSVVLMSEGNYSDAHGFPYAYTTLGIGKTVGMPVPGTMTAVWWERLQDPTLVFGIPQVGSKDMDGHYLENKQLAPDIRVRQDYNRVSAGTDQQLEKAVEVLLNQQ